VKFLTFLLCSSAWAGTVDVAGLMNISQWQFSASATNTVLPADPGGVNWTVNNLGDGLWCIWATYNAGGIGLASNPSYAQILDIQISFQAQADPGYYFTSETAFFSDSFGIGDAASRLVSASTDACTVMYGGSCPIRDTGMPLFVKNQIDMGTVLDNPLLPPSSVSVSEITDVFYLQKGQPCPEPGPAILCVLGLALICQRLKVWRPYARASRKSAR